MKKAFSSIFYLRFIYPVIVTFTMLMFTACDEYIFDNEEPEWLGKSIYDYLQSDSTKYSISLRLIDDLKYKEVLQLTGSKTLFVATDSAYNEFFKSNPWGVSSYEQLSAAQKKILLFYSMVNNSYTMDVFSNYYSDGNLYEGNAMRRNSALNDIDTIPNVDGSTLPEGSYWDRFRNRKMLLIFDNSRITTNNNTYIPLVFFTNDFLRKYSLTDEDFSILTGGKTRTQDDVHIFNTRLVQKDIVCKNGYINVLDNVLIPPMNMAQYINTNGSTKIFSKLLERFCAPYIDEASTASYREKVYRETNTMVNDTVFAKIYFASIGGVTRYPLAGKPEGSTITTLLPYNPGWNSYNTGAVQSDMGAMFVPSDDAMNAYFNSGVGEILRSRYHTWDSVPNDIIIPFLKRHMRTSVIESVPSKFDKMVDGENYRLPVERSNINGTYTAVNGEVYITNEVYPPVDYISVYSPILLSENSKIMKWAINVSETSVDGTEFAFYKLYLNSLVSTYSVFMPTDEFFDNYLDPIAYGQDVPAVIKFKYNTKSNYVTAYLYKYDKTTGTILSDVPVDSIPAGTSNSTTNYKFVKNRLWSILDSHIIVGGVESGDGYYITKANDIIRVKGQGLNMKVEGGYDLRNGLKCNVKKVFEQSNGNTYFIDKPIQPAMTSVYKKLSDTPEFKAFFDLLNGVPDTCVQQIFAQQGIDYRVKFFNSYRYTVYVPTNEKIEQAITDKKLKTWEEIYAMTDKTAQSKEIQKMIRFLKYHFQDDAVLSTQIVNDKYQSATIKNDNVVTNFGTAKNKYYKIGVVGNGTTLTLTTDTPVGSNPVVAKVITSNGLYDLIVKDYIFAKIPSSYKNIDGTGSTSGTAYNTSLITTSASAVIHQIDNILSFE